MSSNGQENPNLAQARQVLAKMVKAAAGYDIPILIYMPTFGPQNDIKMNETACRHLEDMMVMCATSCNKAHLEFRANAQQAKEEEAKKEPASNIIVPNSRLDLDV